MELKTKYGEVKIFAKTIEEKALSQIINFANSPLGENSHIRIMSDCHAGAGCVIGTTMKITDKICPNLVGVDIGCGCNLVKTNINFSKRLKELDNIIRTCIPYGMNVHSNEISYDFSQLRCWENLQKDTQNLSQYSLGTLGGGNHFIEAYENGYISVHSGSRNIGYKVAEYYQKLAIKEIEQYNHSILIEQLKSITPINRENWLKTNKISIDRELCYLKNFTMEDYLHDIEIIQQFAVDNRKHILNTIIDKMNGKILSQITSIHNYIDTNNMILRKGAISAQKDEMLVIPLNMRDGLLICKGKGNEDWNYSAPHGAGRLYSRSKAKETFTVEQFQKAMEGIYSSCINSSTLDEAPFAYKDYQEIMECIEPTVEILKRIIPIYNFKSDN